MSEHEPTKEELYEKAQELDIDGRSHMDKAELAEAVAAAEAQPQSEPAPEDESNETPAASEEDTAGGFGPEVSEEDTEAQEATAIEVDEVEQVTDTGWVIKSRAEEEAEQHERRKAADAVVEEKVANAETTPF
jgi:hypothetical protein